MCSQRDSSSPRAATVIALIRLNGYPDSSEFLLGAQTILMVLSLLSFTTSSVTQACSISCPLPNAVGTEWITPWLPRMSNTHAYCFIKSCFVLDLQGKDLQGKSNKIIFLNIDYSVFCPPTQTMFISLPEPLAHGELL